MLKIVVRIKRHTNKMNKMLTLTMKTLYYKISLYFLFFQIMFEFKFKFCKKSGIFNGNIQLIPKFTSSLKKRAFASVCSTSRNIKISSIPGIVPSRDVSF